MSEAFGELELHPWEFDRYSFSDYVAKRRGKSSNDLNKWHRTRMLSYFVAAPHMKKGVKITDLFPLPGDIKEKTLKDMTGSELKDWYEKRKQAEIKAGLRADDNGKS